MRKGIPASARAGTLRSGQLSELLPKDQRFTPRYCTRTWRVVETPLGGVRDFACFR